MTPLKLGGLPRLQDAVTVVGYPIGGDTVSVTSGVVSRIESASAAWPRPDAPTRPPRPRRLSRRPAVLAYSHGASELLGVQIDAASAWMDGWMRADRFRRDCFSPALAFGARRLT